jgi:hypothetical protein
LDIGENTLIFPPGSVISLVSEVNNNLTMNQVADLSVVKNSGESVLPVEGISDGKGGIEGLTLGFDNGNAGLFSNISISAIGHDGRATLRFTPAGNQTGTAKIKLTLTGGEGQKRQVVFYVFVINASGVEELSQKTITIYPNPANDQLKIEFPSNQFREISITDIEGRLVIRQLVYSDRFTTSVKSWGKGLYIIKMTGNGHSVTERFVVQ